jgi:PAS domain S-box-containing protein
MTTPLRVLILEDQESDCALTLHELQREGFVVEWQRVETEDEFRAHVTDPLDLILADYSLPQFDAIRALSVRNERDIDVPFIIVSGTISEEVAVECMKHGAADYLIKDRLRRLGQAVTVALREKQLKEEKRRAESALHESEARFALAIRGANDGLWDVKFTPDRPRLLPQDRVYYSPRFKSLLGYQEEEFGEKWQSWLECIHPEDRPLVSTAIAAHLLKRVPFRTEYRLRTKGGNYLWVIGHGQALWDEEGRPVRMAGSIRDISGRKQAEAALRRAHDELEQRVTERTQELARANDALRKSEALYRNLVQHFPNGVVALFDRDLRYTLVAGAGIGQLGLTTSAWEGKTVAEVWPSELAVVISEKYRAALAGEATVSEIQHRQHVHVLHALPLANDKDGIYAGMMMTQDITARTEVERLKEELVSIVSHELRTPLTSLRGFSELLLNKQFSPEQQRQFLTVIQQESIRLANLINDFLDLRRIEAGRQVLHIEVVDLNALIRERVAMLPPVSGSHEISLLLSQGSLLVQADEERIHQVLANLLSNAIKYSPKGGKISVGAHHGDGKAIVWVTDQGIGISSEDVPKLFSKFFRVNQPHTKSIGGTGLGLALVKEIVEAHRGRVWVESELGVGSSFFFSLPTPTAMTQEETSAGSL